VNQYAFHVDCGRAEQAAQLFDIRGRLEMPNCKVYEGREAIRARIAEQPRTQVSCHCLSNMLVTVDDEDSAHAVTYLTMYRGTAVAGPIALDGPYLVGYYEDRFTKGHEGWKIASRKLTSTFRRAERSPGGKT
jgi:hypothetical protein